MDCPRVRYPTFNDAVEADLSAGGYQVLTGAGDQVDKVVQLYEVLMTRHTVMVVGQTGGGKSVILNTLAHAQSAMGRKTTLHVLNPKAITVAELYGVLDKDTRDWTDGLLSNMFRCVFVPACLFVCVWCVWLASRWLTSCMCLQPVRHTVFCVHLQVSIDV